MEEHLSTLDLYRECMLSTQLHQFLPNFAIGQDESARAIIANALALVKLNFEITVIAMNMVCVMLVALVINSHGSRLRIRCVIKLVAMQSCTECTLYVPIRRIERNVLEFQLHYATDLLNK